MTLPDQPERFLDLDQVIRSALSWAPKALRRQK
jgi:hypothetical protein